MTVRNWILQKHSGTLFLSLDVFVHKDSELQVLNGGVICKVERPAEVRGSSTHYYVISAENAMYFAGKQFRTQQRFAKWLGLPRYTTVSGRPDALVIDAQDSLLAYSNILLMIRNNRLVDYFVLQPHYWSRIVSKFLPAGKSKATAFAAMFPYVAVGYQNGLVEVYLVQNGELGIYRQPECIFDCKSGEIVQMLPGYNDGGGVDLLVLSQKRDKLMRIAVFPRVFMQQETQLSGYGADTVAMCMPASASREMHVICQRLSGELIKVPLSDGFRYVSTISADQHSQCGSLHAQWTQRAALSEKLRQIRFSEYHDTVLRLYLKRCDQLRVNYKSIQSLVTNDKFLDQILQGTEITDEALVLLSLNCTLKEHFMRRATTTKGLTMSGRRRVSDQVAQENHLKTQSRSPATSFPAKVPVRAVSQKTTNTTLEKVQLCAGTQSARHSEYQPLGFAQQSQVLSDSQREKIIPPPILQQNSKEIKTQRLAKPILPQANKKTISKKSSQENTQHQTETNASIIQREQPSNTMNLEQKQHIQQPETVQKDYGTDKSSVNSSDSTRQLKNDRAAVKQAMEARPQQKMLQPIDSKAQKADNKSPRHSKAASQQVESTQNVENHQLEIFQANQRQIQARLMQIQKSDGPTVQTAAQSRNLYIYQSNTVQPNDDQKLFQQFPRSNVDDNRSHERFFQSGSGISILSTTESDTETQPEEVLHIAVHDNKQQDITKSVPNTDITNDQSVKNSSSTSKFDLIEKQSSSDSTFMIESDPSMLEKAREPQYATRKISRIPKKHQLSLRNAVRAMKDSKSALRAQDRLMKNFVEHQARFDSLEGVPERSVDEQRLHERIYESEEIIAIVSKSQNKRDSEVLLETDSPKTPLTFQQKEDRRMVNRQIDIIRQLSEATPDMQEMFTELFTQIGKILGGSLISATPQVEPREDDLYDYGFTFLQRIQPVLQALFLDGNFLHFDADCAQFEVLPREYYAFEVYAPGYLSACTITHFKRIFSEFYTSMMPKHVFQIIDKMRAAGVSITERDLHIYPISFIWCYFLQYSAQEILRFYATRKHHYVNPMVQIPCMDLFQGAFSATSVYLSSAAESLLFKTRNFANIVHNFASTRCIEILRAKMPKETLRVVDDAVIGDAYQRMTIHSHSLAVMQRALEFSTLAENRQEEIMPLWQFMYFEPVSVFLDCDRALDAEKPSATASAIAAHLHGYEMWRQVQEHMIIPYSVVRAIFALAAQDEHPVHALLAILKLHDSKISVRSLPQLCVDIFGLNIAQVERAMYSISMEELRLRNSGFCDGTNDEVLAIISRDDVYYLQQKLRKRAVIRRVKFVADPYFAGQLINSLAGGKSTYDSATEMAIRLRDKDLNKAILIQNLVLRTLNQEIYVEPAENTVLQLKSAHRRLRQMDDSATSDANSVDNDVDADDSRDAIVNKRLMKIGQKVHQLETLLQMRTAHDYTDQMMPKELPVQSYQTLAEDFLCHSGIVAQSMKDLRLLYAELTLRIQEEKRRVGLEERTDIRDGGAGFAHMDQQASGNVLQLGIGKQSARMTLLDRNHQPHGAHNK